MSKNEKPAKLKKRDLETEKVRFYWDYHRSSLMTQLVAIFSGFVGISTILMAMVASPVIRLHSFVQAGVIVLAILPISYYLTRVSVGLRKLVLDTDRIVKRLEDAGNTVEDLKTLCEVTKEPRTVRKEFEALFPWGEAGIILLVLAAILLIYFGFVP